MLKINKAQYKSIKQLKNTLYLFIISQRIKLNIMSTKEKANVVIYVRVSQSRGDYERQIQALKKLVVKKEWQLLKIFKEKVSGKKSNEEREEFTNALNYVKNNKVDKFLVWEFSRLGRTSITIQQSVSELHKSCCSVVVNGLGFETLNDKCEETMEGKVMVAMLSLMAEIEVDNIKNRLNSGRDNYISNGGKLGRKVGYIKPIKETKNYKTIVDMLSKGNRLKDIVSASGVSANTIRKVKASLKS
jgi:DNA invertase Pin-like site-specific DNA recombinase